MSRTLKDRKETKDYNEKLRTKRINKDIAGKVIGYNRNKEKKYDKS